ncbi:DeoR/GlpR family DNA-binding transcription regulator [Lacrimispora sp.]|uniref:DeoR/GlpR family DNA-binding transcription regulator n=1 Tax=Lacrimispora sp. TaxID=2719234 RepID=UPI00289FAFE3|nr:DeoR/GlpR family DNA-binding transcription regulator [Lacrimispora sp.]
MNYMQRKLQIIDYLNSYEGACSIEKLSKKIYVSRSTLRRDLIALEEEGIINRHHGCVSLVIDSASENSVTMRKMENQTKKAAIARVARNYLHDNMVIFLDSSSTVSYLCPTLKTLRNITVITNGLNIASQLHAAPNLKCYLCPGLLKNKSLSIVGEYSADFLSNFRAEYVFFSCKAINSNGIFEGDDSQALIKRCMIKNADKKILLCDNTKESSNGYFKLASFSAIDILISNTAFSDPIMKAIETNNCKFIDS